MDRFLFDCLNPSGSENRPSSELRASPHPKGRREALAFPPLSLSLSRVPIFHRLPGSGSDPLPLPRSRRSCERWHGDGLAGGLANLWPFSSLKGNQGETTRARSWGVSNKREPKKEATIRVAPQIVFILRGSYGKS